MMRLRCEAFANKSKHPQLLRSHSDLSKEASMLGGRGEETAIHYKAVDIGGERKSCHAMGLYGAMPSFNFADYKY